MTQDITNMFGRASKAASNGLNYLWGSSKKKDGQTNNPHAASHSLTDLDDYNQFDEEKFQNPKDQRPTHIVSSSQSISNLAFHAYIPPQFKEDPVEVVLDKESKYKLSAASSIRFLFPEKDKHNRRELCRYPFYICSNRNRVYCSKMDLIRNVNRESNSKHSKQDDDSDGAIGGVPATSPMESVEEFMDQKESKTDEHDDLKLCQKKMESTSLSSSILSIINVDDLNRYLDSLNLTQQEKAGILKLCEWLKTEKLSIKLCEEMWMAEIIISYFASLSPTNPDLYGTWRRWISYRSDHLEDGLYNVNPAKLKAFFETGIFSIGFDKQRRPVWFVNSEGYDESAFGMEVITKACILWVASMQWDLAKNEYDLFALRRGLSVC